jgi:hypothetical protein
VELNRHIEGLEDQMFSDPSASIQRALEVAYTHYWRTNGLPYDIAQELWFDQLDSEQFECQPRDLDDYDGLDYDDDVPF